MSNRLKFNLLDLIIISSVTLFILIFFYKVKTAMDYNWQWELLFQYILKNENGKLVPNIILIGLLNTLKISFYAISISTVFGFILGISKSSKITFFRVAGNFYVESIRNIPSIVVIFIVYFFIGDGIAKILNLDFIIKTLNEKMLNIFFVPKNQFHSFFIGVLALSIYESAYITEIVAGAIKTINKNQIDAAKSLGLNRWQRLRFIILPQAIPLILPPLTGQLVSTIKDSAILSVISIPELTFQGMQLMSSTYLIFEIWITITLLYLLVNTTISHLSMLLEKKLQKNR